MISGSPRTHSGLFKWVFVFENVSLAEFPLFHFSDFINSKEIPDTFVRFLNLKSILPKRRNPSSYSWDWESSLLKSRKSFNAFSRVDNAQLRRSLARFRCANHKLQIELGRQVKPVKVPVQQRYCKLCNLGAVEDEDHFLLVCPAYQSVRERFRGSLPLTAITPLAELLSCQQQGILARFLVQCQMVRFELLHHLTSIGSTGPGAVWPT
jgi:hypothetical protein